jgi:reverse transcriptase-like protein
VVTSFDAMAHSWIIRFLEHRIADKRILRLIAKWLKVGIVEDGRRIRGVCGAPQGAVISPILANVYLHYVFDLWVHRWRLTKASGDMIVVRYADDTIVGFQHEHEARTFLDELKGRMHQFELALHPDKTRLIRFGRHAAKQREQLGEGKPETFDFLGFTHFCTRSRKWGSFVIGRKTIKKRMRAKLLAIKTELRKTMHDPIAENRRLDQTDAARASELLRSLGQSPQPVVVLQRGEEAMADVAQAAKPKSTPQLGEVYPARRPLLSANQDATRPAMSPLRRQNPREEPGALAAHAGICAGGGE